MGRKTVKLPEEDYTRHNERRKELGLTWTEYIDGQAPESDAQVSNEDLKAQIQKLQDNMDTLLELR